MSRLISELLGTDQPSFSHQIMELEGLIGKPGLDIKLASEMKLLFREKAKLLGLDENDTTAKELYFSMVKLALENSEKLAKMIDITKDDSPKQMIDKSIKFVEKRIGKKTIWALKPNTAKKQLKENPPKKLMKTFGIRSIDSALKRERLSIFYCFAKISESPPWFAKYAAQARKLTNSDFDNQQISLSIIPTVRQKQLVKAGVSLSQVIYFDQESAAVEIAPPKSRFEGDVLFIVDSLLAQIKNMLWRSAYYKNQGLRPDFFSKVEKIRLQGFASVEMANDPFDWTTILHAVTEGGALDLLNQEEPFISKDELLVPSTVQLAGLEFWKHPFGFYHEPGLSISFNLSDMIINAINGLPPEEAYTKNGRLNLKNELFGRYLAYAPINEKYLTL